MTALGLVCTTAHARPCLTGGYATAFRYGFSTAVVAVCLQHVLVTEFLKVLSAVCAHGLARIFAVGGALIAMMSF